MHLSCGYLCLILTSVSCPLRLVNAIGHSVAFGRKELAENTNSVFVCKNNIFKLNFLCSGKILGRNSPVVKMLDLELQLDLIFVHEMLILITLCWLISIVHGWKFIWVWSQISVKKLCFPRFFHDICLLIIVRNL